MSHTPGPWEVIEDDFGVCDEGDGDGRLPVSIVSGDTHIVGGSNEYGAFLGQDQPDGLTAWANARLIASAPEMRALIVLGQRMRLSQRAFFKTHAKESLQEALVLEKEWDRLAERVLAKADGTLTQGGLL